MSDQEWRPQCDISSVRQRRCSLPSLCNYLLPCRVLPYLLQREAVDESEACPYFGQFDCAKCFRLLQLKGKPEVSADEGLELQRCRRHEEIKNFSAISTKSSALHFSRVNARAVGCMLSVKRANERVQRGERCKRKRFLSAADS